MLLFLAACAPPDTGFGPTGSSTIVPAPNGGVYVLDPDAEGILRYHAVANGYGFTALEAVPGRVARAGDRLWVTLPADRGIAVLDEGPDGLVRRDTIETGAEPLGIVARADGRRLYVALATQDEVHELDANGRVLRRWSVGGHPSWLALRPDGGDLYVGSAIGGGITWIDLDADTADAVALLDSTGDDGERLFSWRVTGDPSVSADGERLVVPMLIVDNSEEPRNDEPRSYADAEPFTSVLAIFELSGTGWPDGDGVNLFLAEGETQDGELVRSYLTSATFSPDGEAVVATMEASAVAIVMSTEALIPGGVGVPVTPERLIVPTGAGPRGAVFVEPYRMYVDATLDRVLTRASIAEAGLVAPDRVGMLLAAEVEHTAGYGESPLDPDVVAGRALFHSAVSDRMAADGAGVSCSTCHPAGRGDGLVWSLENGERQTPWLAGGLAATAPFTWADGVGTVAEEVFLTSQSRMGGDSLSAAEAEQVAAYLESLRPPDVPGLGSRDGTVTRGRAIFERADVGCASCHTGALLTDNLDWPLFGMDAVNTPSLRRVGATAPYLHDGRAATLREVLALSVRGAMGDTSMLSEAELADLEAYLASL